MGPPPGFRDLTTLGTLEAAGARARGSIDRTLFLSCHAPPVVRHQASVFTPNLPPNCAFVHGRGAALSGHVLTHRRYELHLAQRRVSRY